MQLDKRLRAGDEVYHREFGKGQIVDVDEGSFTLRYLVYYGNKVLRGNDHYWWNYSAWSYAEELMPVLLFNRKEKKCGILKD